MVSLLAGIELGVYMELIIVEDATSISEEDEDIILSLLIESMEIADLPYASIPDIPLVVLVILE